MIFASRWCGNPVILPAEQLKPPGGLVLQCPEPGDPPFSSGAISRPVGVCGLSATVQNYFAAAPEQIKSEMDALGSPFPPFHLHGRGGPCSTFF